MLKRSRFRIHLEYFGAPALKSTCFYFSSSFRGAVLLKRTWFWLIWNLQFQLISYYNLQIFTTKENHGFLLFRSQIPDQWLATNSWQKHRNSEHKRKTKSERPTKKKLIKTAITAKISTIIFDADAHIYWLPQT